MTENHRYNQPSEGASDWHIPLNENFASLDTDIELRDAEANLGNYSPKSGAKFLATDTAKVFIGDGSQWNELATLGGGDSHLNAIVRLSGGTPTAYRADGSRLSQDSDGAVVIQAAIDLAAEDGGGKVEIEPGVYPRDSKLGARDNVTVNGAGMGATILKASSDDVNFGRADTDSPIRNFVIKDLTLDGDDQGNRTGFAVSHGRDCWAVRVGAINIGGRNGDSGTTPAIRYSGGSERCHIVDCYAERCSSVSIECAINTKDCEIRGCVVRNGVYNSGAGFLHGISVEKSTNCRVENNYIEGTGGSGFSPAVNINNADYVTCTGNMIRNVSKGINSANGPCRGQLIANNYIYNIEEGMLINQGNSGQPRDVLIQGNLIDMNGINGNGIQVDSADANVHNNLIRDVGGGNKTAISMRNLPTGVSVVGNSFRNCASEVISIESNSAGETTLVANNWRDSTATSNTNNQEIVINANDVVFIGNVNHKGTSLEGNDSIIAKNNYVGTALRIFGPGTIKDNVLADGSRLEFGKSATDIRNNRALGSADPLKPSGTQSFEFDSVSVAGFNARRGTYTGDGTTGRNIHFAFTPEYVIVEDSSGTKYDVHAEFGNGFQFKTPSGALSLTTGGFNIGDNGADADPNTDTETYTFYAQ